MTIDGTLPLDTTYVDGSAVPPPTDRSPDGRRLRWQFDFAPADGVTVTLRLRPDRSGQQPSGLIATGELLDSVGLTRKWTFPSPPIVVLGSRP
jgi:hypothetical protein